MHSNRWSDLEYVLAVATEGSLAAAARLLNVNHSTVLRRVKAFEQQTKSKIFERMKSGYKLTPEGEMFLDAAQSIDAVLGDLDRKIAGGDKSMEGPLSITTTDAILPAIATDIVAFQRAYPKIITEIVVTNDRLDLDQREADIAVRASNQPPPHLVGRRVCGVQFAIYAPRASAIETTSIPFRRRQWLGLEYPLSLSSAGEWMDANIPSRQIVLKSGSFKVLSEFVGHGLGHAILPRHVGDASQRLVRMPSDFDLDPVGLWLLSHKEILRSSRVRTGVNFLYKSIKRKSVKFEGS